MAAPYQYPQYQQGQQYQQPEPRQQPQSNGYGGYQQHYPSQTYPTQPSPTQQYPQQHHQAQQWPQQQHSQAQYPPQQYTAQQYAPQQYTAPQQGGFQQHQASYGQPAAQVPTQSCYNCGSPGHWAQDCPEAKRDVPAGSLNPEQRRRQGIAPPKRNTQIVTSFAPHVASTQASPQGYTAPYSAGGYAQYPPSYTPSYTPAAAQSAQSPAQYWPQQGQQYAQQYQPYQQTQSAQIYQMSATSPQNYSTPATPGSVAAYGPPQASQVSPSSSFYGYHSQTPQGPYEQPQALAKSPTPAQANGQQSGNASDPVSATKQDQADDGASASMDSKASSPRDQMEEGEDAEPAEDNLNLLDVPDLPHSVRLYGKCEAVVPLVGMPIPANFVVADALFPMDPPAPEDEGRCQSKYLRHVGPEDLYQNIRDSNYWKEHKEDTIFMTISNTGSFVSFEDCRSNVLERQKPQADVQRELRSESRSAAPTRKDVGEMAASLEQLEKMLAETKAKQAAMIAARDKKRKRTQQSPNQEQQPVKREDTLIKSEQLSPPQSATIENGAMYPNDSEDILASLGVTGMAKPNGPPSRLVLRNSSANEETKPRSRSTSKADIPSSDQTTDGAYLEPRSGGGYEHQQPNQFTNGYHQLPQHHSLPPLPPRPFYQPHPIQPSYAQPAYADGTTSGSPHAGIQPNGHAPNGAENGYGNYQYQAEGQPGYTPRLRSDSSANRKRNYDNRESSSDEGETPARRQEDDITPKLKRRQPKVAEAYSRRW